MPNKSYIAGSNLERTVKRILEERGLFAMRSAASKTVVDVFAMNQSAAYLVQCKTTNEEIPDLGKLYKEDNVVKLQNIKVPAMEYYAVVKYLIWKGKGSRNYYQFRWLGNRWSMCSTTETQLISIEEFLDTPRKRSNHLKKEAKEKTNQATADILSKVGAECIVESALYEGEQTTIEEIINEEIKTDARLQRPVSKQKKGTTPKTNSGGRQQIKLARKEKPKR